MALAGSCRQMIKKREEGGNLRRGHVESLQGASDKDVRKGVSGGRAGNFKKVHCWQDPPFSHHLKNIIFEHYFSFLLIFAPFFC